MSKAIVQTKSGELIPKMELPEFGQAVVRLEDLETDVAEMKKQALAFKVKGISDEIEYARAGAIIAQKKAIDKTVDASMAGFVAVVKQVADFILARKKRVKTAGEEVTDILEPVMSAYNRKKKERDEAEAKRIAAEKAAAQRLEAEEQERKNKEAAAEIRKQTVREAKAKLAAGDIGKRAYAKILREAGEIEESMKAEAEALAEEKKNAPVEVKVETKHTAVAGVVRRTNYFAKCTDEQAFIAEAIKRAKDGDYSLVEFLVVSDQKLGETARKMKDSKLMAATYPFVEATDKDSF